MSVQLLTSQRNSILKLIQSRGLNSTDFEWNSASSRFMEDDIGIPLAVPRLAHIALGYFYVFDLNSGEHFSIMSPGRESVEESRYPGSWSLQMKYVGDWLSYILREEAEQDLWTRLTEEIRNASSLPIHLAESAFSDDEIQCLSAKLDNVAEQIDAIAGKSDSIASEIDYLKGQLRKQNRRDWFFMLVGVFVSLGTGLALSPEQGMAMVSHLKGALGWVQDVLGGGG